MFASYLILSVVSFFLLQLTIIPLFSPSPLRPDLALLASIYFGLHWGEKKGLWIGFLFGLVEDSFSVGPLGFNALIKSYLGFTAGYLRHNIAASNLFPQVILILAASLLDSLIVTLAWRVLSVGPVSLKGYALKAPLFAGANCVAGPIMFRVLKRVELRWKLRNLSSS